MQTNRQINKNWLRMGGRHPAPYGATLAATAKNSISFLESEWRAAIIKSVHRQQMLPRWSSVVPNQPRKCAYDYIKGRFEVSVELKIKSATESPLIDTMRKDTSADRLISVRLCAKIFYYEYGCDITDYLGRLHVYVIRSINQTSCHQTCVQ